MKCLNSSKLFIDVFLQALHRAKSQIDGNSELDAVSSNSKYFTFISLVRYLPAGVDSMY